MGRFRLDLPATLGEDGTGSERTTYAADVDRATVTFLRWFDCWAGTGP